MFEPPAAPTGAGLGAPIALALGAMGLATSCYPIVGLAVAAVGLLMGLAALGSPRRGLATAAVVLCLFALAAAGLTLAYGHVTPLTLP